MEYATTPQECIKPYKVWGREIEIAEKDKSLACTTRKATPKDIAEMLPTKTLAYDICAEMGIKRKQKKKPDYPYEIALQRRGDS